jgi:hypothetical protein
MKIVDVIISNLRKKLSAGLSIETVGMCYVLNGAAAVSAVLEGISFPMQLIKDVPMPSDGVRKAHGREPTEALNHIRKLVNSNMVASFTSRHLARIANLRTPVSETIDRLERNGLIFIRSRPGRGQSDTPWVVYLRARGQ